MLLAALEMATRSLPALALVLLATAAEPSHAQDAASPCGGLRSEFGPFDYRTDRDKLPIVEGAHFTPPVEALIHGVSGPLGAELAYVLARFPNHHRALAAMMRLSERTNWVPPKGARYDMDCYFERALRFRPDDVIARLLFVSYLGKRARRDEALRQLDVATMYAGDNGFTHYNIGLQYLELGQFGLAGKQAQRAQSLGFTNRELVDRLRSSGQWKESTAAEAVDAPPGPSATEQ